MVNLSILITDYCLNCVTVSATLLSYKWQTNGEEHLWLPTVTADYDLKVVSYLYRLKNLFIGSDVGIKTGNRFVRVEADPGFPYNRTSFRVSRVILKPVWTYAWICGTLGPCTTKHSTNRQQTLHSKILWKSTDACFYVINLTNTVGLNGQFLRYQHFHNSLPHLPNSLVKRLVCRTLTVNPVRTERGRDPEMS